MKKFTRILTVVLAAVLAFALAACSARPAQPTPQPTNAAGQIVLKVGASPAPHTQILNVIKPLLLEQGIDLQVIEFDDYVLPNTALESGELDANYFQHLPYLEDFNAKNNTHLISAAAIHFEPLGIYAGKTASLDALTDGATIAVPNDSSNEARALQLLQANGLITLNADAGLQATVKDITSNPKNLKIEELEAAQVPRVLADVDLAVANGNYALGAQITDKLLTSEAKDSQGAQKYGNIVAVREGDEDREDIKKLIAALTSDTVRSYIEENFSDFVVPLF
ncbi:MAG: MetQ/NlpA family ABC transporter substrate-binding protein [Eubacteriales bacterium]|nr:MetQ/NlpA family ABC transporter substrate-binding protein [Eubacteriales bacterium]